MAWGDKKHELNVSTYHMCILLLFNEADQLSYRDIAQATSIPSVDLKRALQSLALVKVCLSGASLSEAFDSQHACRADLCHRVVYSITCLYFHSYQWWL